MKWMTNATLMDEPFTVHTALMKGLFEGVEGQVRVQ